MRKFVIIAAAAAVAVALVGSLQLFMREPAPSSARTVIEPAEVHSSLLYGRVTNVGGVIYEGRFRTRDGEEQFWDDLFNGRKPENRWAALVPPEELPRVKETFEILGVELGHRERDLNLARPFMTRFGDIARIDATATDVRVTLKSGTVVDLNRLDASDFDDGLRIWDRTRGVVDLDNRLIRSIELLPAPGDGPAPARLYGTVHSSGDEFSGFVRWNRDEVFQTDDLAGRAGDDELSLRFETIASIEREGDGSRVRLRDGREIVLSASRDVGPGNRGIYVNDLRYGRVLISWKAFDRIDFDEEPGEPVKSGPSYDEFPPGSPMTGTVVTRDGRELAGRLVFDLDESETTETLDAPSNDVNFIIPFGLIASVVLDRKGEKEDPGVVVIFHAGEELVLERKGDLDETNAGILIFTEGQEQPEYLPWTEIARIDFDAPPTMYPPISDRSTNDTPP